MHIIERSSAVAGLLMLLLGCTSPAPEPASAEAVERAVTEAELRLEASKGGSEQGAGEAEPVQAEGTTT